MTHPRSPSWLHGALLGLGLVSGLACGGGANKTPVPSAAKPQGDAAGGGAGPTDLTARPTPYEIDFRRRTKAGDDEVLKLTDVGARYGIARDGHRVAIRYDLASADLDEIHAVLQQQKLQTLETEVVGSGPSHGSSIRVKAGPALYSISAMGRRAPIAEHADAYARSAAAITDALPNGTGPVMIEVRWDGSMAEHSAAVDLDLGAEFAGLTRGDGTSPNVDIHLTEHKDIRALVRHGAPPKTATLELQTTRDKGIAVRYDEPTDTVVASLVPR